MTTTEQRLSDALRNVQRMFDGFETLKETCSMTYADVKQALAAYDAQQAAKPSSTAQDVDRLLGLADQFLEDWRESNNDDPQTVRDGELEDREREWPVVRALILQRVNAHDGLVAALHNTAIAMNCAGDIDTFRRAVGEQVRTALAAAGVRHA